MGWAQNPLQGCELVTPLLKGSTPRRAPQGTTHPTAGSLEDIQEPNKSISASDFGDGAYYDEHSVRASCRRESPWDKDRDLPPRCWGPGMKTRMEEGARSQDISPTLLLSLQGSINGSLEK